MLRTETGSWGTEEATLHFQYLRQANEEKHPVLIFLHDALGSIAQWRNFPLLVAQQTGLDALIYERLGHGQSTPLNGRRTTDYLQWQSTHTLPHLLRSLGIVRPILIGHSDGGTIALLFAGKEPTSMIITIAAHVLVEPITLKGIRQATLQKNRITERLQKYHGDKATTLFDAWANTWLSSPFDHWNIVEELKNISCPVLAIQGTEDQYGSEAQFIALNQALGKKVSTTWIPQAGHAPHLTHTERLVNAITNFIQSRI